MDFNNIFGQLALAGELVEMPQGYYLRGWGYLNPQEPPPMEFFNYLFNNIDQKIKALANITGIWQPNEVVEIGYVRRPRNNIAANFYLLCTVAGTTGATEPTWPDIGETQTDGSAVWEIRSYIKSETSKSSYLTEFRNFFEQIPPAGWAVRNGAVLTNADIAYVDLWAELQKNENAWKLKAEADWQTMSTTAGGIGGVPFFVLDTTAKTIRLPDTRGDYIRDAGGSNMPDVGEWREGTILTAVVPPEETDANSIMMKGLRYGEETGLAAFSSNGISATGVYYTMYYNRVRPRSFTTLPCVYVGGV